MRRSNLAAWSLGVVAILATSEVQGGGGGIAGGPCPADINNSGSVNVMDLLALIGSWGPCPAPCAACDADLNDDCLVNVGDLLMLIGAWGPCPCPDAYEPHDGCAAVRVLASLGSDQTNSYSSMTLHTAGDVDYFMIPCVETDNTCYCGFPQQDEDYIVKVTLSVPANTSSAYSLCMNVDFCSFPVGACQTVQPGSTVTLQRMIDGACTPGSTDSYDVYVSVERAAGGGMDCSPYGLSVFFDAGYCQ